MRRSVMRVAFIYTALGVASLGLLCSAPQTADGQSYGGTNGRAGSMSATPYPTGPTPAYAVGVVYYPVYTLAEGTVPPVPVVVRAYDDSFEPRTIRVTAGTTVTWVNNGRHVHTATSDEGAWDTGDLRPGTAYAAMFTRPGVFKFSCRHHKGMEGTIVVTPSPAGGTGRGGY